MRDDDSDVLVQRFSQSFNFGTGSRRVGREDGSHAVRRQDERRGVAPRSKRNILVNFKTTEEMRELFKVTAAQMGLTMGELVEQGIERVAADFRATNSGGGS
jgi:hypothetical protein